jgi:hypothetical protein
MAIMHPRSIENYDYTETEKELFECLEKQLPDGVHVFYSVRWFDTEENKRVDSESDFLIFDPNFGFLTIEVKGGAGIEIDNGEWYLLEYSYRSDYSKRKLKCSPFIQAEKSMRHFHKYFYEEYHQSFNGVYGYAVAFPRYSIETSIANEAVPDLIIDVKDLSALKDRINRIFHYWKNRRNNLIPFSPEQKGKFISAINKRVALSAAAGALIGIKQKEFDKINFVQDSIIDFLTNYNHVRIVGGAGTGKTFIAKKKAEREARLGKRVLFICKNEPLIRYIKSISDPSLEIDHLSFMDATAKALNADARGLNLEVIFDSLCDISDDKKYDAIIVDEAQDFDLNMGYSVRSLLKNSMSGLYILFDNDQNIFNVKFEDAFAVDTEPYLLRYNIRNTGCIYDYAKTHTGLGKTTIANGLSGVDPECHPVKNTSIARKTLTNIVNRLIQRESVSNQSIVILSNLNKDKSILANDTHIGAYQITSTDPANIHETEICFKTIAEYKGLESDIVIFLNHECSDYLYTEIDNNNEYVALTRARYYLYILEIKQAAK